MSGWSEKKRCALAARRYLWHCGRRVAMKPAHNKWLHPTATVASAPFALGEPSHYECPVLRHFHRSSFIQERQELAELGRWPAARLGPFRSTRFGIGSVGRGGSVAGGEGPWVSSACSRRTGHSFVPKIRVSVVQFHPWPPFKSTLRLLQRLRSYPCARNEVLLLSQKGQTQ